MRTYELRVYSLRTMEALRFYAETIYPRHLCSFPLFGVEAHGFWTKKDDANPRLFVLVSYAEQDDPGEVSRRYLESAELAKDVEGFQMSDIIGVESTILTPSEHSPLR